MVTIYQWYLQSKAHTFRFSPKQPKKSPPSQQLYHPRPFSPEFLGLPPLDGSGHGAVIVGYNGGYLEDGTLDFTKPVDAYGKASASTGRLHLSIHFHGI